MYGKVCHVDQVRLATGERWPGLRLKCNFHALAICRSGRMRLHLQNGSEQVLEKNMACYCRVQRLRFLSAESESLLDTTIASIGDLAPLPLLFPIHDPGLVRQVFARLLAAWQRDHLHSEHVAAWHDCLLRLLMDDHPQATAQDEEPDALSIYRLCAAIDANLDQNWSRKNMCAYTGMQAMKLHRCMVQLLGLAPGHYHLFARLGTATALLHHSDLSITAIAKRCGFRDTSAFSRIFREHLGFTPSAWRADKQAIPKHSGPPK